MRRLWMVLLLVLVTDVVMSVVSAQPPKSEKCVLQGRLTDAAGRPVAGVRIQLYSGIATRKTGESTVTDADGRYRFDPLENGGGRAGAMIPGVQLVSGEYASADGRAWWDVEVPLGTTFEKNFTMVRGGTVQGTLTFGAGDWMLRDFDVRIVSADKRRTLYGTTDNSGTFTSDALLPGEYVVQANDSRIDYAPIATVTVEAGKPAVFKARCLFSMRAEMLK